MALDNLRFWKPSRALFAGAALSLAAACGGKEGCDPTAPCADTQNPVVSVSANNATNPTTFTANATDDKGIKSVQFRVDGAAYGAADMSAPYEIAASNLTPGQHTLTAIATDIFDKTTTSAPYQFTIALPTIADIAPVTFKEGEQATSTLTAQNCTNPQWSLGPSMHPDYTPTLSGNILTHKGRDADANGTNMQVPVKLACTEGAAADKMAAATITPMSRIIYELREARSDSLIKTAATLQLIKQGTTTPIDIAAANGIFDKKVEPGTYDVVLVNNAETFKSDRVLQPGGALAGINWEGNDRITVNYANDMSGAGRIVRLGKEGSPYGSLAEMMRIYNAVWAPAPENTHVAPVFTTAKISILNGLNASYGCIRAPTAQELDVMTQGALDTKNQFGTTDYNIVIDTVSSVSSTPSTHPEGLQILCVGGDDSNGVLRANNGKIIGGYARVSTGFNRVIVRDELYELHAGQKLEDNENGQTFYAANRPNGIMDLTLGDKDIELYVNRLFARDAEKKRLVNNSAQYILK